VKSSILSLGVPVMDRDHAEIEAMMASVATTIDDELIDLFDRVANELEAHFLREEAMMNEAQVPILDCHKAQHAMILREVTAMRRVAANGDPAVVRTLLASILPQLIDAHLASVDRVTADFLNGKMSRADFDNFRLPAKTPTT
jgi:hemerythrin